MKRTNQPLSRRFIAVLVATAIAILCFSTMAGAETTTILVLPFKINAEKDLAFMQKGIYDMLSTRLSYKDEVVVVNREKTAAITAKVKKDPNADVAAQLGESAGADYVVLGSLTVFGDSISTDARFINVTDQTTIVTFSETGQNQGDVIYHLNVFSGMVNEKVFGRKTFAARAPATSQPDSRAFGGTTHPEEKWLKERGMKMAVYGEDGAAGEPAATLWKSRRFQATLRGIAIGDVDGDGKQEAVFISNNDLYIYRFTNGRFQKVTYMEGVPHITYLTVDTADINGNKTDEIIITSIDREQIPTGCALEYDGGAYKKIVEKKGWFFRVLRIPGRAEKVLLGQEGGNESIFHGRVYEMVWAEGEYSPSIPQALPADTNVLNFNFGDILNTSQEAVIGFDKNEYLNIYINGTKEWTSEDYYGGNLFFLVAPFDHQNFERQYYTPTGETMVEKIYFMPQRIHVVDLNRDGKNEVIVVRNHDVMGHMLQRTRSFKKGYFDCLSWDNVGLAPKWKTRKFTGFISDNNIGDIDNDGNDELVFCVVHKDKGGLALSKKSYIVSWDMNR